MTAPGPAACAYDLRFFSTSLPGGKHNPNKVVTGFWPLWTGLVPAERVAECARHLLDPRSFWRSASGRARLPRERHVAGNAAHCAAEPTISCAKAKRRFHGSAGASPSPRAFKP